MKAYQFNKAGVSAFLADVLGDVLDRGECNDVVITSGSRTITLPILPEVYEELEAFLPAAEKAYYDEYEREG